MIDVPAQSAYSVRTTSVGRAVLLLKSAYSYTLLADYPVCVWYAPEKSSSAALLIELDIGVCIDSEARSRTYNNSRRVQSD